MARVTLKDFVSDTPPERIIGVECEYNQQVGNYPDGSIVSIANYISDSALKGAGLTRVSKMLNNGGALYCDVGHLEYDTPECLGPKEAAAADIAGSRIMAQIVQASGLPHKGLYRIAGSDTQIYGQGATSGYHENYLFPRYISELDVVEKLLPAFAASSVWSQSGMVRESYVFSQKAWGINGSPVTRQVERRTGDFKPMFMIPPASRDEDTIGSSRWARLERRFADAGHSPEGRFLEFATTSLMLRILEHHRQIGYQRLERFELANPALAARIFAGDLSLRETVTTADGRKVTSQNIQEGLIEIAYLLDQKIKLPDDESQAIRLWEEVVTKLGNSSPAEAQYGDLVKKLDMAARHAVLARKMGDLAKITKANPEAVAASLIWDQILPDGAAKKWWEAFPSSYITPSDIEDMQTGAKLPRTRAAIRMHEIRTNRANLTSANWASITYLGGGTKKLDNFYATS